MNNDRGAIAVTDMPGNIIEDVSYSAGMHSDLLRDHKGVSLERISYRHPSGDPSGWHSANENSGFATPGYRNSQYSEGKAGQRVVIAVEPKIFSPDNSGYDDIVTISYELVKPGFAGSIYIFDSKGRVVKRLARNELLGTSGTFTWNGRDEANRQSPIGIYIIMMEVLHPDGETGRYKQPVVLAGRL
jgi:hypothetical protein